MIQSYSVRATCAYVCRLLVKASKCGYSGRCCGCGADVGEAAEAEEAAHAVIAGRRSPTPTKVQRGRRRPTPHFCQTTNAARARYTCVPAVLLSKDKRCLFLCVACMHRRAQQCPTMPRHVELLVYCFSPFQTRRLGECHPLDTPARVGFTKTPLFDAYASEPGVFAIKLDRPPCL